MRQFLVSTLLLLLAAPALTAQRVRSLDIGVTLGSVSDYYRFTYGPRWEDFLGVRGDAELARTGRGAFGVTAQIDAYRYNSGENLTCPGCNSSSVSDVLRLSSGPFWRYPIGHAFDISGAVFGGVANRIQRDSDYNEDDASHLFYSAELGAGVHVRGFRIGAQWETGFMQRVRLGTRDNCELADPAPGSYLDCRTIYGPRSFTRYGVVASYRVASR